MKRLCVHFLAVVFVAAATAAAAAAAAKLTKRSETLPFPSDISIISRRAHAQQLGCSLCRLCRRRRQSCSHRQITPSLKVLQCGKVFSFFLSSEAANLNCRSKANAIFDIFSCQAAGQIKSTDWLKKAKMQIFSIEKAVSAEHWGITVRPFGVNFSKSKNVHSNS